MFCLLRERVVGVLTVPLLWREVAVLAVLAALLLWEGEVGVLTVPLLWRWVSVLAVLSAVGWWLGGTGVGGGGGIVDISNGYLAASCRFSVCTVWVAVC
jgi:hypothetical protein